MSNVTLEKDILNREFERQLLVALQDNPFVIYTLLMQEAKYKRVLVKLHNFTDLQKMDKNSIEEVIRGSINSDIVIKIGEHFKGCLRQFIRDALIAQNEGNAVQGAGDNFSKCMHEPF